MWIKKNNEHRPLTDGYQHKGLRRKLVEKLVNKGINNEAVLQAIGRVPRHIFFDQGFLRHAYEDKAFPIGDGQTISQPYTVAFQSTLLNSKPQQKVLEVGTGSGYHCCVLLEMKLQVFTIECRRSLHEKARKVLHELGYYPHLFHGDGSLGLAKYAPYHAIIVTAGAPQVPRALLEQLKVGGRLIIPVGKEQSQEMLRVVRTSKDSYQTERFQKFRFVPLVGRDGWRS